MSDPVVVAINDLTRVMIALHGDFKSKAETIRRLDGLAIPASRIAAILAMDPKDVSSSLAKSRKKHKGGPREDGDANGGADGTR
jgi:hypothetical protein